MAEQGELRLEWLNADQLQDNPDNWRKHPTAQIDALKASLEEVGWAGVLLYNERTHRLIDGHARKEISTGKVPVLIGSWTEEQEKLILATLDPLGAMAEVDQAAFKGLLVALETESPKLQKMLDGMAGEADLKAKPKAERHDLTAAITDWQDAKEFFSCPEDVRAKIEAVETIVVLFSGGKDSLAALLWATKMFPEKQRVAVFADPGVEFPGIGAYVVRVAESLGAEVEIVKSKAEWWSWLAAQGRWPSLLYRNCATKFIHAPMTSYVKARWKSGECVLLTGSRAQEATTRSIKTATSPLPSYGEGRAGYAHYASCFRVRKTVIEEVLAAGKMELWPGYARGFVRTACWCCPGQCSAQALALERNYPGLAAEIRSWEKVLGPLRPMQMVRGGKRRDTTFDDLVEVGQRQETKREKREDHAEQAE